MLAGKTGSHTNLASLRSFFGTVCLVLNDFADSDLSREHRQLVSSVPHLDQRATAIAIGSPSKHRHYRNHFCPQTFPQSWAVEQGSNQS
jgi:hypothetical protein